MRLHIAGRRGGKTTRMIERLKSDPKAIMLVLGSAERGRIVGENSLTVEQSKQIVTFDEFSQGRTKGRRMNKLLIDNLDSFIHGLVYDWGSPDPEFQIFASGTQIELEVPPTETC